MLESCSNSPVEAGIMTEGALCALAEGQSLVRSCSFGFGHVLGNYSVFYNTCFMIKLLVDKNIEASVLKG